MRGLSYIATLLCCASFACTVESDDPAFAIVPAITLDAQSATEVTAFADTLRLTLSYQDGDGDLGGLDGDSRLYVHDSRLPAPDAFDLRSFTPNGEALSIEGTLDVVLGPYFLLGNAGEEVIDLELWITDRAGHESNRVFADEIRVLR